MSELNRLWPEDLEPDSAVAVGNELACSVEPNAELGIVLLAAGCTPAFIRQQCGFKTLKEARAFCRDPEVKQLAREASKERAQRVGDRALVGLERILTTIDGRTDLRAVVLAIRTGLEVSGMWKKDIAPPLKSVGELSVGELNQMIADTQRELENRISRQLPVSITKQ